MKTALLSLVSFSLIAAGPSTEIKVDQAGYLPGAPKVALVVSKTAATEFSVRRADGSVAFRGKLGVAVEDADSGDRVRAADFSKLARGGRYYLEVPGVGRSWDFAVSPDVYARAFYLALRSFYGQRCGTAVDLGPEFPGFKYDACHLQGGWHDSSGKSGSRSSVKGWHDAGDYGRYVVNSGITTGTLLWTWELFGHKIKGVKLNIPESGNGTPDILNEIRWNLEWMLSMQDADGGVWHKQTTERFSGFVLPHKDTMTSFVIGTGKEPFKSTCATADFAAVMAIAARAYKPFDRGFAEQALQASRQAWSWTRKNPELLFSNPPRVSTGGYGDRNCSDEILWAAAELWRTTRDDAYHGYFQSHHAEHLKTIRPAGPPSWPNVAPLGLWTWVLGGSKGEAADAIRKESLAAADQVVSRTAAHGYRHSMTTRDFVWGSNSVAANYGLQLLVANSLRRDSRYVYAALDNLHYLLGRNPLSISWVTQLGANPFRHPHHRPSGADSNPDPWPGLLAGGPNRSRQDPAMKKLPDLPPAKMYVDDQASYASNENCINWNAPLVFLLAGAM